jgi:hypothetical protein
VRSPRLTFTVAGMLLSLAAGPTSGCQPTDGSTGANPSGRPARPVYCTVLADPVRHESIGNGAGDHIVAPAHFRCDSPGLDSLVLTVALQQKVNDQWVTVVSQQFTASGAGTTRARTEAERVRQVVAPCAKGTYRTFLDGVALSHTVATKYSMHGPSTNNPCGLK